MQAFTVKYDRSIVTEAMLLAQKASGRTWVYVGVISFAMAFHYEEEFLNRPLEASLVFAAFVGIVLIGFKTMQRFVTSAAARRWLSRTPNQYVQRSFELAADHLKVSGDDGEQQRSWQNFDKVVESEQLLLLFYNRRSFEMIPKIQLPPQQLQAVTDLLKEKISYFKSYK